MRSLGVELTTGTLTNMMRRRPATPMSLSKSSSSTLEEDDSFASTHRSGYVLLGYRWNSCRILVLLAFVLILGGVLSLQKDHGKLLEEDTFSSSTGDVVGGPSKSHSQHVVPKNEANLLLPSMDQGGLIVFHHVPKTGGTTIRMGLEKPGGKIKYHFCSGRKIFDETVPKVGMYFRMAPKMRKKPIMIVEVHGRNAPTLIELEPFLIKWKDQATKAGIPTFYFTILREPWSHAISYFNFFYVQRENPYFTLVNATEENFASHTLNNPQCQFLVRGEFSLRNTTKQVMHQDECQRVQDIMLSTMDWVGTTESMSTETLPILSHLLHVDKDIFRSEMVSNKSSNVAISKSQLSQETLDMVDGMLSLDQALYTSMKERFSFSMWDDFAKKLT